MRRSTKLTIVAVSTIAVVTLVIVSVAAFVNAYTTEVGAGYPFKCGTAVHVQVGKPVPSSWTWATGDNLFGPDETYRALFIGGNQGDGIPDQYHDTIVVRYRSAAGTVLATHGPRPISYLGGALIPIPALRSNHISIEFKASQTGAPVQTTWCGHDGALIE